MLEVGLAATYWAGLRVDEQLVEWGIPLERRGERLRILCDTYGLSADERSRLFDELNGYRRERIAARAYRGTTPVEVIHANLRWTEEHAAELSVYLV